jgi:hypothetical protein
MPFGLYPLFKRVSWNVCRSGLQDLWLQQYGSMCSASTICTVQQGGNILDVILKYYHCVHDGR